LFGLDALTPVSKGFFSFVTEIYLEGRKFGSMNVIQAIKQNLEEVHPKSEVILFGSRARNDFHSHSDWDFLILVDKEDLSAKDKEAIRDMLYDIELEKDEVISSIIHTKKEWVDRAVTPLYQIVQREGQRI
jgi:predicted nucleotidyltransferase